MSKYTKSRFDRDKLPEPVDYYSERLQSFKHGQKWCTALCPFHGDRHRSFGIKPETGAYKCFTCGVSGGDVLAFHQAYYNVDFKTACKELGAWS